MRHALLALVLGIVALASPARADEAPIPLRVTRTLDTVDCPDAGELAAVVNTRLGRRRLEADGPVAEVEITVKITRPDERTIASLRRTGVAPVEREVWEGGFGCGRLARSLADALATLATEDATPPPPAPPSPGVTLAAGAAYGLADGWHPQGTLAMDWALGARWRLRFAGWWLPESTRTRQGAQVRTSFLGGALAACFTPWPDAAVRAEGCVTAVSGRRWASASAPGGESISQPALVAAPALGVMLDGPLISVVRWHAAVSGLAPFGGDPLVLAGAEVYSPARVAVTAAAGLRVSFW
jgi:hypothetical protein